MTKPFKRVAFIGWSRTGKDTAADVLTAPPYSYVRRAVGDLIKEQLSPLVQAYLGFSAFTQIDAEKNRIRSTLEAWGDANYEDICDEFFDGMPELAANPRLCRAREGIRWLEAGGVIFEVTKPGVGPRGQWEADAMRELLKACPVQGTIVNDGSIEQLWTRVLEAVGLPASPPPQP